MSHYNMGHHASAEQARDDYWDEIRKTPSQKKATDLDKLAEDLQKLHEGVEALRKSLAIIRSSTYGKVVPAPRQDAG